MRFFICLLDPAGRGIGPTVRREYESLPRARGLEFRWQSFDHAAALTAWDDLSGERLVATCDGYLAVGSVRLDNRHDVERWAGATQLGLTDLELALRAVARHDTESIPRLLGDFALVVWNGRTHDLVAATDPFAVRRLYYAERQGLVAFASRGEALALGERYDPQHLAELTAGGVLSRGLCAYEGVQHLPGGALGVLHGGRVATRVYWDPGQSEPEPAFAAAPHRAAETCRELLAEAVRLRLTQDGRTWAQLSGGLDSSSVVGLSQWLAERGQVAQGLTGTVTYVDQPGTEADERDFSDLVVRQWQLPNHTIVNPPLWVDGDAHPPHTDQPRNAFATHPRERRLAALVQSAGGQVLLSGFGGDELFTGTMLFFADWVAGGRIGPAVREMARRATIGHVSFWDLSYRNAVLPLLPRSVHRWLLSDERAGIPWLRPTAVRRYGLRERLTATAAYSGPVGGKYRHALIMVVTEIGKQFDAGLLGDLLEVRYPFLYRPLVEFALRLPPDLCARPQARKWILREAMRGILPEPVRTRVGKGDPRPVFAWSLATQRPLHEPLTRDPILAQLGIIDATRLRAALDGAPRHPHRDGQLHNQLHSTLSLEAWLQLRAGRWPPTSRTVRTASPEHVHQPSS